MIGPLNLASWQALQPRVARPWSAGLRAACVADEVLSVTTSDGVRLHVERLHPRGQPSRGAVVLCHGLGSNGLGLNFPEQSLADYLARAGFDCFVPDLRGARHSDRPDTGWGLGAYIEHDLPSVIALARRSSGYSQVHWVGHSMGGLLLLMYLIEHPEAPIDRIVAVGSALDYRSGNSMYRRLLPWRPMINRLDNIPFGALSHWLSPLAGFGPAMPSEAINFWRPNMRPSTTRTLLADGFDGIPVPLLAELATTFDASGFARSGAAVCYLEQACHLKHPTFLIAGSRDVQCPVQAVEATARLLSGSSACTVERFGRAHGHAEDYGHFDLLLGKRAPSEVWPAIRAWLE